MLLINPNVHNRVIFDVQLDKDSKRSFSTELKVHLNVDDIMHALQQISTCIVIHL